MAYLSKICKLSKTPKVLIHKILHRCPKGKVRDIFIPFPSEKTIINQLENLNSKINKELTFIFPLPACPWGYMFQRPQQLARALAEKGHLVIYMVDTSFPYAPDYDTRGLLKIKDNLYLYNDNLNGELLQKVNFDGNLIVWQYWPHQLSFIKNFISQKPIIKIYDCIDHLDTFTRYPGIEEDFKTSIMEADIVLATAKTIFNDLSKLRTDRILVPNGVCAEDFRLVANPIREELKYLRERNKVIVGYYGAIAEWFDFKLIKFCASANPDWTFLLVGEVYPSVEQQVRDLNQFNNVIILPRVPYTEIPQLLSIFDIAMIPFLINDITINTSPVKVFEYMAGEKITVSTDLPEVRYFDYVYIAKNAKQFNSCLRQALEVKDDRQVKEKLWLQVIDNTWKKRVDAVLLLLERLEN